VQGLYNINGKLSTGINDIKLKMGRITHQSDNNFYQLDFIEKLLQIPFFKNNNETFNPSAID
jgi:hypothetical protein